MLTAPGRDHRFCQSCHQISVPDTDFVYSPNWQFIGVVSTIEGFLGNFEPAPWDRSSPGSWQSLPDPVFSCYNVGTARDFAGKDIFSS
jgi:hypothetical protein